MVISLKNSNYNITKFLSFTLFVIVISHTLVHVAGSLRSSLFPVIKNEFLLTNTQIGIIAAIPPLCQALFTFPAGHLADRFTSRKMIALSIAMAIIGSVLAGGALNVYMYIAATSLLTLSSTFYHPPANSYLTKATPPDKRTKFLGILGSGGTSGFALGSFSITFLLGFFGFEWRQLYLFWVIPPLFALVGLFFIPNQPTSTSKSFHLETKEQNDPETDESLFSKSMISYLFSSGIRSFGGGMTTAFLSIYLVELRGWTVGLVGILFGIGRLLGIVSSSLGGSLAIHFHEKRWAVSTLFLSYTFFLLAFLTRSFLAFFAIYLAYRFTISLSSPATSAIVARLSPRDKRGRGFALSFLPGSIVRTVGPIVAAFIAEIFGMFTIFIASGLVFYLGVAVLELGVKID